MIEGTKKYLTCVILVSNKKPIVNYRLPVHIQQVKQTLEQTIIPKEIAKEI